MSLFARREITGPTAAELIPQRTGGVRGAVTVTNDTALRHSAVWACLRLRANLISTMPIDVFRKLDGIHVEIPSKPPILTNPGGERVDIAEWMYSSQVDLDRTGNVIGLITERNSLGLPSRIELQSIGVCSVIERNNMVRYRIDGKDYPEAQVWHERQYTLPGLAVGLSPVAYAAWSIGQYQSAEQFALGWYGSGSTPKAHFKNTDQEIVDAGVTDLMKQRFKASIEGNDIFVTGKGWEYKPLQAVAVGSEWLEAQKYGIGDIARFFDCPGDLIDAVVSTGHITYASITQRNLQFLIMHLGPAVFRRERALTKLLPRPRFVKLNASALLRMDDQGQAELFKTLIDARVMVPSEAREKLNRPPYTEEQMAEFDRFFGKPQTKPTSVVS